MVKFNYSILLMAKIKSKKIIILLAIVCLFLFGLLGYVGWQQWQAAEFKKELPTGFEGHKVKVYDSCVKSGNSHTKCLDIAF
jgi:hypothetical protein